MSLLYLTPFSSPLSLSLPSPFSLPKLGKTFYRKKLLIASVLCIIFMLVEIVGEFCSSSLCLSPVCWEFLVGSNFPPSTNEYKWFIFPGPGHSKPLTCSKFHFPLPGEVLQVFVHILEVEKKINKLFVLPSFGKPESFSFSEGFSFLLSSLFPLELLVFKNSTEILNTGLFLFICFFACGVRKSFARGCCRETC